MFNIECFTSIRQLDNHRKDLIIQGFSRKDNFIVKLDKGVEIKHRLILRHSFYNIRGYDPNNITFYYYPSQDEINEAKNRVMSRNGKVFVFDQEVK